ncbi:MAG TPA: CHAT domain-containing tetratricopeptide repeat protein, partial [Thermoanaerobaculia bacterium]
ALDDLDRSLLLLGGQPRAAEALDSRGFLLSQMGRPAEASADLVRALDLYRKAGDRRGEAVALNDLGILRQAQGSRREAREAFETAATGFRDLGDHPNEAAVLVNLGRLRAGDGDLAGAESAFRRALQAYAAAGRPAGEVWARMGLAQVTYARGDVKKALRDAETSLAQLERLRLQPGSLSLRASLFASYQDAFAAAVDMAMELHRREPAAGHDVHAFEISERARARSLLDALGRAAVDPPPIAPALQARETAAGDRLAAAERRRAALVAASAPPGRVAEAELELRRCLAEIERLEAASRPAEPPAGLRTLTLREVRQETLDPSTVLLEYALGERRSFLWAVSSRGFRSYELPPRQELESAALRAHALLVDSRRLLARGQTDAALAELSRLVLGSAAAELTRDRLVIVPAGALHLIPFGALPDPAVPGSPLLVHHEIVSAPSASSLAAIHRRAAGRGRPPAVVAVLADPVFDAADPRVTGRREPPALLAAAVRRGVTKPARPFSRLLSSREEARTVLALAPPGERLAALDFAARRSLAVGGALERFRIIHFATHGVVDTQHPELSGIALSMVDERGRPQNGFLRAYEIYRLRLPADLVVLSACETALGKDVRGEGVVGLARAFLYAGTQRVLVSLWPLEDKATAELMRRFYEGLFRRGLPPAEALRQAQTALRSQAGRQAPYYWAGFVLLGDWH